ncbi:hypothetical protein JKP88DRAFT_284688 [Tribonema minus]|uniref:Uncharacterized protein n=1 Tax=Tribonema minus TaxID=303371 RepID=A0A835ZE90_9STRA|nr:hypothetical protein JKP88DRAFT_284688 [Tribonema minus]
MSSAKTTTAAPAAPAGKPGAKTGHGSVIEKVADKNPRAMAAPSESDKIGEMLAAQEAAKRAKKAQKKAGKGAPAAAAAAAAASAPAPAPATREAAPAPVEKKSDGIVRHDVMHDMDDVVAEKSAARKSRSKSPAPRKAKPEAAAAEAKPVAK